MNENTVSPQEAIAHGYISVKDAQELSGKAEITIRRFLRKIKEGEEGIPADASIQVKRAGGKKHYTYVHKKALLNYFGIAMPESNPTTSPLESNIEVEVEPMEAYQSQPQPKQPETTENSYQGGDQNREVNAVIPINEHKDIINQFVIKLNEAVEKEHKAHAQLSIAENNLGYQQKELQRATAEVEAKRGNITQLRKKQTKLIAAAAVIVCALIIWANFSLSRTEKEAATKVEASQEKIQELLVESAGHKSSSELYATRVGELTQDIEKERLAAENLKLKLHTLEQERARLEAEEKKLRQKISILTDEPPLDSPFNP